MMFIYRPVVQEQTRLRRFDERECREGQFKQALICGIWGRSMQGERKIHEGNVDGRGRVIIGTGASPAVILVASQIGLWRIGR